MIQGPAKFFNIYAIVQHLNKKITEFVPPKPGYCYRQVTGSAERGHHSSKSCEYYNLFESSMGYVWSFIICSRQDMEVTNQFVNSGMNKTTAIVVKLVEPLLGHGHTHWTIFIILQS
jgi:hypothetical protein